MKFHEEHNFITSMHPFLTFPALQQLLILLVNFCVHFQAARTKLSFLEELVTSDTERMKIKLGSLLPLSELRWELIKNKSQ